MMPEPLKTALCPVPLEDTSLALPSDRELRSAEQRVLEQVHTIKRSKSKKFSSRSVSGLSSPTSPESDAVFYDFKLSPVVSLSGPLFSRGGTMTNGRYSVARKSTSSRSSTGHRVTSSSGRLDRPVYAPTNAIPVQLRNNNPLNSYPSTRSAPELGLGVMNSRAVVQKASAGNGTFSKFTNGSGISSIKTTSRRPASLQSNGGTVIRREQVKDVSGMNGEKLMAELTMREAVDYLFSPEESFQLCGAAYIQHSTFTDEKAKQEVLTLKGILPLVNLLGSGSPQIQETVAAALRNAVFKNQPNKEEVQRSGGITQATQMLVDASSEMQKHLTGLLWNLSSAEGLKQDLLRLALPTLTEKVLEPFTASRDDNANTGLAPEVFYNATACLRNLSASKLVNRQAMRNCRGLIDSLISYMEHCVNAGTPDNQSLENCVCILHNLTYQLESEMPALFSRINALASYTRNRKSDTGPIGCFSSQSHKLQQESGFDFPVLEESSPKGASWLFHSRALQSYLSLLSLSEREATQEACCGALQNLTASTGTVSNVLSHTIVQKLSGLKCITPLLESANPALQKSAVALIGNLSRSTRTKNLMARNALTPLVSFLKTSLMKNDISSDFDVTMATALHSANTLIRADPESAKSRIDNTLVNGLNSVSLNPALPKSSTAAGVLLHSLWSDKNIQSFLKKQGMNKKSFVNDVTSAAFKSLQVID